jgi:hypothetical protein
MKGQSDVGILGGIMAALVACGSLAATAVQAQPINETAVTPAALPESPPLCGDIRGRVVIVQLEEGATYMVTNQNLAVMDRSSTVDSWEVDHANSGN